MHCKLCNRKNHQICVLHKKEIWKEFQCYKCLESQRKKRKENRFTAKNLPECALSKHIEDRVNSHIKAHDKTNEGMGQNLFFSGGVFFKAICGLFCGDLVFELEEKYFKKETSKMQEFKIS